MVLIRRSYPCRYALIGCKFYPQEMIKPGLALLGIGHAGLALRATLVAEDLHLRTQLDECLRLTLVAPGVEGPRARACDLGACSGSLIVSVLLPIGVDFTLRSNTQRAIKVLWM